MADYEKLREERLAAAPPEVQALFNKVKEVYKPLRELGLEKARSIANSIGNAANPVFDPDIEYRDVDVPGKDGPVPTRIYIPKTETEKPKGIYVHVHGGGFVAWGGLDSQTNFNTAFAKKTGCIVVGPDFRLPPEHPFPAPLDDAFAAFKWTVENAESIGGQSDRIAIGGGCTGGNLSAATTLMAREAGMQLPAALYLYGTAFDLRCDTLSYYENSAGYGLTRDDCMFLYEMYLQDWSNQYDWRASVMLAEDLRGFPPTHIRVGEWDVLRDEGRQFANRLKDAGSEVEYVEAKYEAHGIAPYNRESADKDLKNFLDKYVG